MPASPISDFRSDNDSRKHQRRSCHKFLRFFCNRREYKALVADIGRGGAFILTKENFALGKQLKIIVPQGKTRKVFNLMGWVIRVSPEGIGVSFERRCGRERRSDLDRRTGLDRRSRRRRESLAQNH